MDINVDGKPIKAIGVPSKQGWIYTFDRITGQPVWPIVERPVEKGTVPGEWYSPTQPFPTKPAPFDRQGVSEDDLIDWTPELKAEALGTGGKAGTLMLPNATGGANWEGGAFDPETGIVYIFSTTNPTRLSLVNDPARSNMNFIQGGGGGRGGAAATPGSSGAPSPASAPLPPTSVFGLPLIKPPYGRITAINMNTGDHVWMQPVGDTPENITNHEKLKGVTIPKTGRGGRLGIMVTKTLLWGGERGPLVTVNGQQGSWFRSYDKATGEIVSETLLPANTTGVPMTYMANKKQYIVVAVAAAGRPAELVALALP
jgi:quinoprotein glucose dehydrogenase